MSTRKKNLNIWGILSVSILLAVQFVLIGCTANQALFKRNSQLTEIFESYEVLPEYQYYATGPYDDPYAILGVHRDYTLTTEFWRKYDLTPELLFKWLRLFESRTDLTFRENYYASYIVNPAGKRIGVWYSLHDWTTVKILANNQVDIFPPNTRYMGDEFQRGLGYSHDKI